MDKFRIYHHKDVGPEDKGLYELRMHNGQRWSSSIWGPTLSEVKSRAYEMYAKQCLFEVYPEIPITEGSATLVWEGKDLTNLGT